MRFICLLTFLSVVCGCSEATVAPVRGTIVLNGRSLFDDLAESDGEEMVLIEFVPQASKGPQASIGKLSDPESAIYSEDGSFRVPGKQGIGIPPGNYKIVVQQLRSYAVPKSDLLLGRFIEARTPLSIQVRLGEKNVANIELSEFLDTSP